MIAVLFAKLKTFDWRFVLLESLSIEVEQDVSQQKLPVYLCL